MVYKLKAHTKFTINVYLFICQITLLYFDSIYFYCNQSCQIRASGMKCAILPTDVLEFLQD